MSTNTDWIPRTTKGRNELINRLAAFFGSLSMADFGFIEGTPQMIWTEAVYCEAYDAYIQSYANVNKNKALVTKEQHKDFREKEAEMIKAIRILYTAYLRDNPAATDTWKVEYGFPIQSKSRSRNKAPDSHIIVQVTPKVPNRIDILYHDEHVRPRGAKPKGYRGGEKWAIVKPQGEIVKTYEELTQKDFKTENTYEIQFREADQGKVYWFALRWQNTTGEVGPWSPIMSVIIP
ncbi:MAG: hypothetical protein LBU03_04375 [Tannerellaceae bacterium]|jgi:hypothetical protein|nr:hypothetical protein [Tannerellaceae bacterium]